jgi:hypothetical protein
VSGKAGLEGLGSLDNPEDVVPRMHIFVDTQLPLRWEGLEQTIRALPAESTLAPLQPARR